MFISVDNSNIDISFIKYEQIEEIFEKVVLNSYFYPSELFLLMKKLYTFEYEICDLEQIFL